MFNKIKKWLGLPYQKSGMQFIWAFPDGIEIKGMKTHDDFLYVVTTDGLYKYVENKMERIEA